MRDMLNEIGQYQRCNVLHAEEVSDRNVLTVASVLALPPTGRMGFPVLSMKNAEP
jgi:hypothetical protein